MASLAGAAFAAGALAAALAGAAFASAAGASAAAASADSSAAGVTTDTTTGFEMGDEVMHILHGLRKDSGTTIVMVTHDPRLAEQTSRTVRLFDGRQVQ